MSIIIIKIIKTINRKHCLKEVITRFISQFAVKRRLFKQFLHGFLGCGLGPLELFGILYKELEISKRDS